LLFGLTPALRSTRMPPSAVMNATGRGLTATREGFGMRRGLVVVQIALSLVLAASALLFVRSLRNLMTLDAGFQQDGIAMVYVDFSKVGIPKEQRIDYKRQLVERMRGLPAVESAAEVEVPPMSGYGWSGDVEINGQGKGNSPLNRVSPQYFKTLGIPLLAGRDFGEQDTATSLKVAIVNRAFAKKFFGGNAIGQTFHLGHSVGDPDPEYEVIGEVADSKYYDLHEAFGPTAYFPASQDRRPDEGAGIVIRSGSSLEPVMAAARTSFRDASPAISIEFHVSKTQIRDGLLRERLMATLSGIFGGLAAVLAVVGLYGVMAYMVARRTGEIGIRMALGATPG